MKIFASILAFFIIRGCMRSLIIDAIKREIRAGKISVTSMQEASAMLQKAGLYATYISVATVLCTMMLATLN
jgi:hypothetical protein